VVEKVTVVPLTPYYRKSEKAKDSNNILGIGKIREFCNPNRNNKNNKQCRIQRCSGFRDKISTANFENHRECILFMETVVMKPYLSYLPQVDGQGDNDTRIRNSFMCAFRQT
jgi:hypothetical protein